MILPGHLLDVSHKRAHEPIEPQDLIDAERTSGKTISGGSALVLRAGQDVNWGTKDFFTERPYVTDESARWLVARGITLFCTDLIAIDDPDEWWEPTHTAFLKGGVPMVQQLNILERLVGREFTFIVLPLPMRGGTASPVRPVALLHQ